MSTSQPDGYLALPPGAEGGGVLVLHAWWGLNETMKAFCDHLAASGFVVFAPDLYHGQVANDMPGAEKLGAALDANYQQAQAEIATAAHYLYALVGEPAGGVAVIGFSLGAFYALDLSNAEPELIGSVVVFYGTGSDEFEHARASYLGHFAEDDPYEPLANVDHLEQVLRDAGRPVTFYRYPGTGHWFFEPDRQDAYDVTAANLAWERTLAFLRGEATA